MSAPFQPMLASAATDVEALTYPLWVSPKLDGIRAVCIDGALYSRNLKLIPNLFVQASLGLGRFHGLDGELIVGDPTASDAFRVTSSGVMSFDGRPDFTFWVFDNFAIPAGGFLARCRTLNDVRFRSRFIKPVTQVEVRSPDQLLAVEQAFLAEGYEGVMLRSPEGVYKFGRSTVREGALLKLKRFADGEAVIAGFEEQMENTNEAKKDALGRTERSTHKAGKRGKDTLGAFVVRGYGGEYDGVEFSVGTGLVDAERDHIWRVRDTYLGAVIKFKYFPTGSKDAPRFPVFLGFRAKGDMS